jgi:hypothetical protein
MQENESIRSIIQIMCLLRKVFLDKACVHSENPQKKKTAERCAETAEAAQRIQRYTEYC